MNLSSLDKRILNRIQKDIPLVKRPWKAVADELKIGEPLLLERMACLKKNGLIRRTSGIFNPRKVGFASSLVALKVRPANLRKIAEKINLYPEVTHNYSRDCEYNLWFTLVARSKERISQIVFQLKKDKDILRMLELPAIRLFKIDVNFMV